MKSWIRKTALIALIAVGCIALQKFCRSKTDGFAMYKIQSALKYDPQFETDPIAEDEKQRLDAILDQPYYYLGKGAQCYAFVSEDGQSVLKFFRLYHLRVPSWFEKMPLPSFLHSYRQAKVNKKYGEFFRDFLSYKIASDHLKEETGLVFVHLNKTSTLKKKVTLYDKIFVKHIVDLDQMEFLIQKKADLFYPAVEKMIGSGDLDSARRVLSQLVSYLAKRSEMGFYDKDPDINTNFGVFQGQTIQIDVGRFRPDETRISSSVYVDDIRRVTDNLKQWLETKESSLATFLEDNISALDTSHDLDNQLAM